VYWVGESMQSWGQTDTSDQGLMGPFMTGSSCGPQGKAAEEHHSAATFSG
jgi:hypothetical protein